MHFKMQMHDVTNIAQTPEEKDVCLNGLDRFLTIWVRERLENDSNLPKVIKKFPQKSKCIIHYSHLTVSFH